MNIWSVNIFGTAALAFMLCMSMLVISGTAFAERCVDNGDGTVTDNGTGLMWQKKTAGKMNWSTAMSYASGLSLGGHLGWRLPDRYELMGLYHSPCKSIMDVVSDWGAEHWSSTTATYTGFAWHVDFHDGYDGSTSKTYPNYVITTRAAQRLMIWHFGWMRLFTEQPLTPPRMDFLCIMPGISLQHEETFHEKNIVSRQGAFKWMTGPYPPWAPSASASEDCGYYSSHLQSQLSVKTNKNILNSMLPF